MILAVFWELYSVNNIVGPMFNDTKLMRKYQWTNGINSQKQRYNADGLGHGDSPIEQVR